VIGIDSAQITEEGDGGSEALVPVAGHLGLEPSHAVLDIVLLGDAANGEQHLTGDCCEGQVSALVEHLFDIDVTKFQR
jgi:hypothetical protein